MNFIYLYLNFWRKSFDTRGRASWLEYWIPILLHMAVVQSFNKYMTENHPINYHIDQYSSIHLHNMILPIILMIPTVTIGMRRLQDMNINGRWNYIDALFPLISLLMVPSFGSQSTVPQIFSMLVSGLAILLLIGFFVLSFIKLLPGNKEHNKYGNPRKLNQMKY